MSKKEKIKKGKRTVGEKVAIWLASILLAFILIITSTVYAIGGIAIGLGAFAGVGVLSLTDNGAFRSAVLGVVDTLIKNDIIKPSGANSNTYEVTFDPNGGELPTGVDFERSVIKGKPIGALPVPNKEGNVFIGWFEAEYDKLIEVEATTLVDYDMELIAIWGEAVNIYLNPNGGTLPEGKEVHEGVYGKSIGRLPTPERAGYEFLGWYESGTDTLVNSVTVASGDIEIVAKWRALDTILAVEFKVGQGEEFIGDTAYFEIVRGERVLSHLSALPTARLQGYKFIGWQDQDGNDVTLTVKVEKDLILTPVWEKIIYCSDNTENHYFGAWVDYNEATCTEAARRARQCMACGYYEFYETLPKKGHNFGKWNISMDENSELVRARECKECGIDQINYLENVTLSGFKAPTIDGTVYGKPDPGTLINGLYNDTNIAGNGTTPIVVTMEAREPTYVDILTVKGEGSASYTVAVTYANGDEQLIGISSFGELRTFEIKATVLKIVIDMQNPSNGQDYWQEIGCYVIE